MAELVDALDSGSSEGDFVEVQVLLSAPCGVFLKFSAADTKAKYFTISPL